MGGRTYSNPAEHFGKAPGEERGGPGRRSRAGLRGAPLPDPAGAAEAGIAAAASGVPALVGTIAAPLQRDRLIRLAAR